MCLCILVGICISKSYSWFLKGHFKGLPARRNPLFVLPTLGVSNLLCHLRPHGPVCFGQRGGGCFNETPGGEQQGTITENST